MEKSDIERKKEKGKDSKVRPSPVKEASAECAVVAAADGTGAMEPVTG